MKLWSGFIQDYDTDNFLTGDPVRDEVRKL